MNLQLYKMLLYKVFLKTKINSDHLTEPNWITAFFNISSLGQQLLH